jgi:23S rRNA pseudouridine1911/1915/1917 synthase
MTSKRSVRHHRRSPSWGRLDIVYEDKDLLVANKPAGLLTMATDREKRRTLYALLREHLKGRRPPESLYIVHRLDREASGLLVFAKSEAAKQNLQGQFKEHDAARSYVAVVEHRMVQDQCTLQSYLAETAAFRCYSADDPAKGKLAITHVKVQRRSSRRTLVEVQLETGRKHQIRVHLAEQGYPIVGDQVYGSKADPIKRLALHAARLAFRHPTTGKPMEFQCPPPACLVALVKAEAGGR